MRRCNVQISAFKALLTALHVSGVQGQGSLGVGAIAFAFTKKPSSYDVFARYDVTTNLAKKGVAIEPAESDNAVIDGKGKKRKTSTKRKKSTEPSYWPDEDDPFIVVANREIHATGVDSTNKEGEGGGGGETLHGPLQNIMNSIDLNRKTIKFTIRGNPRVLKRHRTARGFMYNPSRAHQDLFRDCLLELLPRKYHPTILDDGEGIDDDDDDDDDGNSDKPIVLFPQHEYLKMSITFRMKRPMNHFISSKPGPGRLKPSAPGKLYASSRSDVDNLAKFVMDSLNALVYADDRQVVHLNAIKVLDCEGSCRGRTDVEISVVEEEDL